MRRLPLARLLLAAAAGLAASACGGGTDHSEAASSVSEPQAYSGSASDGFSPAPNAPLDSLIAVAIEQYFVWNLDSAQVILTWVLAEAGERNDVPSYARALTWFGLRAYRQGNYAEARRVGEDALEYKLQHNLRGQLFRSYNALGLVAWLESRLTNARNLFEQAIHVADQLGNQGDVAAGLGNLALVSADLGDFAEARKGFMRMREVGRALGDTLKEANALTNLGMLEIQAGDPRSAIPLLLDARALYRSAGLVGHEENPISQLGAAYAALGLIGQAHATFDTALALAHENDDPQAVAANTEQLADLYTRAGEYRRALQLLGDARALNQRLGLQYETGTNLRAEAVIHSRLRNLELARDRAEEASRLHQEAGAHFEKLRDLVVLAEVSHLQEQQEIVEESLAEAADLAETLGTRAARVEVGLAGARIALARREFHEALESVQEIQAELPRGGYAAEWEAEHLRAGAYLGLGDLDAALRAGNRAVATVERVRQNLGSGVLRTGFAAAKLETYSTLVEILLKRGDMDSAFEAADAARGRSLTEHLLEAEAEVVSTRSTASALRESEELLRRIDRLVISLDAAEFASGEQSAHGLSDEVLYLRRRLAEARGQYEALLIDLSEHRSRRGDILASGHARLTEIQRSLRPSEILLEYLVTGDRLLVFVVSQEDVRIAESVIKADNLASRVRLARELLGDPESPLERSVPVLQQLYQTVIEPAGRAAPLRQASHLIIVPHDVLTYLPFAALQDPVTGQPLAADFSILHLPSAAALPALRSGGSHRTAARGEIARAQVFAPFPKELPASRDEVETVGRALVDAELIMDRSATERRVREALAGDGIVHVASHAVMNVRNPMFSRISLHAGASADPSDDGRLEVHELLGLTIRAPLVFLSGCETGVGAAWSTHYARGEDYATLAQAFLYAGARSVVASLWRLEDDGAAVFADLFYRELRQASPVDALARAQRRMMELEEYASPYYWAAYRLYGTGE